MSPCYAVWAHHAVWAELKIFDNLSNVKIFQKRSSLPLHVASSLGNFKMVKFLLSHDFMHVDEEDSEGMTPILRYNQALLRTCLSILVKG